MDTKFVRPAPGLRVLQPERDMRALPETGDEVPLNQYWLHRLRDGDVVEAVAPKPAAKPPKKEIR